MPRSSSCCSSGRRAADSGRLSQRAASPPPHPYSLISNFNDPPAQGGAEHSIAPSVLGMWWLWGHGGLVAAGAGPRERALSLCAILSLQPGQGRVGVSRWRGHGGDTPENSDVPPWCYRGQPGAAGICPLGKGGVATMLRDTPGPAPCRGEHSWSWGYPWHPQNLPGGTGGALVHPQPWLSPVVEG